MLTVRYIRAFGNLMSRRLWATCKLGSLELLGAVWSAYTNGQIDSAEYHQRSAELLGPVL